MSETPSFDSASGLPSNLADEIVRRLFTDGPPEEDDRILFPGLGQGELVDAVGRYSERHQIAFPRSVAFETDDALVERARDRFAERPLEVLRLDFLDDLPDLGEFDYIVSDPPVEHLRSISLERRKDLAARFDTISADGPGRDEDLYLAFVERGLQLLAPDGRLVCLTPDFTERTGGQAIPEIKRRLAGFHIEDIDEVPIKPVFDEADLDLVILSVSHAGPDPDYVTGVDFDGVEESLTAEYEPSVQKIMTKNPATFYADDDVHDVYVNLIRNDYDAAPVRDRESGEWIGLISRANLTSADSGTLADGDITAFDDDRLLSFDATFEETLERLRSRRFCLVGTRDDVRGIVTRFDLNSIEVYFHLYAKFARFEIGLRNAIRDRNVDWEEALLDGGTDRDRIKKINEEYRAKGALAQDVLDMLYLSELIKIVENSEIAIKVGIEELESGVTLSDINSMRGAVAHYQPIIHTLDTIDLSRRRTADGFGDIYDGLNECIEKLRARQYI